MSTQHFHGGHFQGCSFGDRNSVMNYSQAVDQIAIPDDEIKQKLKEARAEIERLDLADDDKGDLVEQLKALTNELAKPERETGRVRRYWGRIREVAPTVAAILASAGSIAALLGGG